MNYEIARNSVIVRPIPEASLYKIEHCFSSRMPARSARRGGLSREKRQPLMPGPAR